MCIYIYIYCLMGWGAYRQVSDAILLRFGLHTSNLWQHSTGETLTIEKLNQSPSTHSMVREIYAMDDPAAHI